MTDSTTEPQATDQPPVEAKRVCLQKVIPEELMHDELILKQIIDRQRRELGYYLVDNRLEAVSDINVTVEQSYLRPSEPLPQSWWQRLLGKPVRWTAPEGKIVTLRMELRAVPSGTPL